MEKKIAILGANSFIGKKLLKRLGDENCILLSSSKSKNTRIFKLGDDLNSIISDKEKIEKIIILSWERRNILKDNEDINIYGIKKIFKFAKNKKIPIYFVSSVSALSRVSRYGKTKYLCEGIIKKNENNRIFRLGMVTSENGGLIFRINELFSKLPFILIPGTGDFKVNFVKIDTVINTLLKKPNELRMIQNVVDHKEEFIRMLNTQKKIKIYIPHFFSKIALFIFNKIFKINSSFTYDGYLSLINDPNEIEIHE